MTKIEKLLYLQQNVFSVQDLATLWGIADKLQLWSIIRYYLRTKKLYRIYKGIYAIHPTASPFEIAHKVFPVSYISFYTALAHHGIIFQYHDTIHSMAIISKQIEIEEQRYFFHQIKENIFFDFTGVEQELTKDGRAKYSIAGPERAICDSLYLEPGLTFDNVSRVNLRKLKEISMLYKNKNLEKQVEKIILGERQNA